MAASLGSVSWESVFSGIFLETFWGASLAEAAAALPRLEGPKRATKSRKRASCGGWVEGAEFKMPDVEVTEIWGEMDSASAIAPRWDF